MGSPAACNQGGSGDSVKLHEAYRHFISALSFPSSLLPPVSMDWTWIQCSL